MARPRSCRATRLVPSPIVPLFRAALVVAPMVLSGCWGTTGRLAAASTRNIAASELRSEAPPRHVIGRSCIDLIVVFPTAMPNFGDAVEDALRQTGGSVLTDVTIRYELYYVPLVYGMACYVAEGNAR